MTPLNTIQLFRGKLAGLMLICLALILGFSATSAIAIESDEIETEEDLRQYVAENTDRMIARLEALRDEYDANDEAFYREMEAELASFIDFRRIAARVMARYGRQASPEQRDQFVEKFKRSLFNTYARALVDTEDFEVKVGEARFLNGGRERATVDLTITSSQGNQYSVAYSLYRDDQGRWLMENVIVEGVNIGLAFRDRFQQDMEQYRGNLQAVIDNWSGEVKELEEKAEKKSGGASADE